MTGVLVLRLQRKFPLISISHYALTRRKEVGPQSILCPSYSYHHPHLLQKKLWVVPACTDGWCEQAAIPRPRLPRASHLSPLAVHSPHVISFSSSTPPAWIMDFNLTVVVLTIITSQDSDNYNASFDVANASEGADSSEKPSVNLSHQIGLGIFFGLTILAAIGGNLLVCTAVFTERRLRRIKNNYFIVSLAVADLLMSGVVMTFAMVNDVQNQWIFGEIFCRIWMSLDIMFSTASILNLCVISFDRYKHIQNAMYYDAWMTSRKAIILITFAWVLSGLISFVPIQLGWHHGSNYTSPPDGQCIMKLNFVYAIFSSTVSFYAPCVVMLVLYFRLFLLARKHAISIQSQKRPLTASPSGRRHKASNGSSRSSMRASDNKAAFTLGVITGVFLFCWLPFFIINPVNAYDAQIINADVFLVSTWLGYVNSCLNPIIYSIFNTEFREAFKRILCLSTCRRGSPALSVSRNNSTRTKQSYGDRLPSDNGSSLIRKTSRDYLFHEKITCV